MAVISSHSRAHRAQLADFGDELHAGIDEEAHAADGFGKFLFGNSAALFGGVENSDGGRQCKRGFFHRIGASFLQMIRTKIDRIPFGQFGRGECDCIAGQAHRGAGRKDVGAAGEIFLNNVVLRRALQACAGSSGFVGDSHIQRKQPRRRRVDRHRGVHFVERNAVEQHPHVAQMRDRHADLADFAPGERMVAIVAGLGGQIERHRQAGLSFGQVGAIERIGGFGARMARIGAEDPGFVVGHQQYYGLAARCSAT